MFSSFLTRAGALLVLTTASSSQVYVDASASPGGDGSSWGQAYRSLQVALASEPGESLFWVARGLYLPTGAASLLIDRDVEIYGGFLGSESFLRQRPCPPSGTFISGAALAQPVVQVEAVTAPITVRLDGLEIRSSAIIATGVGGGLRVENLGFPPSVTLSRCKVADNFADLGGGIAVVGPAALDVEWSLIDNNNDDNELDSGTLGGGIYVHDAALRVFNSRLTDNGVTSVGRGGGIYLEGSGRETAHVANTVFVQNGGGFDGAAVYVDGSGAGGAIDLRNCTLYGDRNDDEFGALGGATLSIDSVGATAMNVYNSIIWSVESPQVAISGPASALDVRYSNIEASPYAGTNGNLDVKPRFVNAPVALATKASSPVNDAGSFFLMATDMLDLDRDGDITEAVPLDVRAFARRTDDTNEPDTGVGTAPIVDMGAFEYSLLVPQDPPCGSIKP